MNPSRSSSQIRLGFAAILCLLGMLLLTGCQNYSPSKHTAPRIIGQVVDASTHQPIVRAAVNRTTGRPRPNPLEPERGGQFLLRPATAYTDKQGRFALASERALLLFRKGDWYQAQITVEHGKYLSLKTNYTVADATDSPSGEPVVDTGVLLLTPKPF
jgi:hypothetical protein